MTSKEQSYLLAIKAELPIAIFGGILSLCVGIARYTGFGFPWTSLSILCVLLAVVIWYDSVFYGRYCSLVSNSIGRLSIAISICYLLLEIIAGNLILMVPLLNTYNLFALIVLLLFWFGYVHTFMIRTGMRRWIPSLFTSIMLLLSYVLATEFIHLTDVAIILMNTTIALFVVGLAGLLYHHKFRLGTVALIAMTGIVFLNYALFIVAILSTPFP
jgi:hypothetical protein